MCIELDDSFFAFGAFEMKKWLIVLLLVGGCLVEKTELPEVPGYDVVGFRTPKTNELTWRGGNYVVPATGTDMNGEMWIVVPKVRR